MRALKSEPPVVPMVPLSRQEARRIATDFERQSPQDLLRWAFETWGTKRIPVCTSFQVTGMVILDKAWRVDPSIRVITLDTGRLPQATYALIERIRERYGIQVEMVMPDAARVQAMVREKGPNLFYGSIERRMECCDIRKVEPLKGVLSGVDGWVAGLRRDQSSNRAHTPKIEIDYQNGGIVKINPLADWTIGQVWEYVRRHKIPYNSLYDQGYSSIGCTPCTRSIRPGEAERAGRWWWEHESAKECGLHSCRENGAGHGGSKGNENGHRVNERFDQSVHVGGREDMKLTPRSETRSSLL